MRRRAVTFLLALAWVLAPAARARAPEARRGGLARPGEQAQQPQIPTRAETPRQQREHPPLPVPPRRQWRVGEEPPRQAGPMAAPPVLYIEREEIRPGKLSEHGQVVRELRRLYDRAGWRLDEIAGETLAGPEGEVVYLNAFDSFAAFDRLLEQFASAPNAEQAALAALEDRETSLHRRARRMLAVFRPDLSFQPDAREVARARFLAWNEETVKFGRVVEYEEQQKLVARALEQAGRGGQAGRARHWFTYEVVSGAPPHTYVRIEPLATLGNLDAAMKSWSLVLESASGETLEALKNFGKDTLEQACLGEQGSGTPRTRVYALLPDQSRVSAAFARENPAFWRPARPAALTKRAP